MNEALKNFFNVAAQIWKSIGIAQKVSILLIVLCTIAGLVSVVVLGSRPSWEVLYTDLDIKSSSDISALLRDENVPLDRKHNNRTILVPREYMSQARDLIAQNEIEVEGSQDPFKLFDKQQMGKTESDHKMTIQRTLQRSSEIAIKKMPGIRNASVIIMMSERRPFSPDESKASASVFLSVPKFYNMDKEQIVSIRQLIANSVKNLDSNDISITDSNGRTWARAGTEDDIAGLGDDTQSKIQRKMESYLKAKAEGILLPVLGSGKVVAMVNVELDFSQETKVVESFKKSEGFVLSKKSETESSSETGQNAGVVGPDGNTAVSVESPDAVASTGVKMSKEVQKAEEKSIVPTTKSTTLQKGARIKHLSVAVNIAQGEKPRTADEMAKFTKLISSAVGAINSPNSGRVDSISVFETPFSVVAEEPVVSSPNMFSDMLSDPETFMNSPITRAGLGAFLLLALLFLYKKVFASDKVNSQEMASISGENLSPGGLGEVGIDNAVLAGEAALEARTNPLLDNQAPVSDEIDLIQQSSAKDPEIIANAIESWIVAENKGAM